MRAVTLQHAQQRRVPLSVQQTTSEALPQTDEISLRPVRLCVKIGGSEILVATEHFTQRRKGRKENPIQKLDSFASSFELQGI